jgi:MFS family permease
LKHLTEDFLRNRQSRAISAAFFALGFLFGNWATFIPYVKGKFDLNDADLGLILLSLPVGALTANMVGAWLVSKIGMKTTTIFGMIGMAIAFAIPVNVPHVYLLPLGLYLCGAGVSITNIAMNLGVTSIEADQKINIMSTSHGIYSVGLMTGSLAASFARGASVVPGYYMAGVAVFIILLAVAIKPTVFKIKEELFAEQQSNRFFLPKGAFLIMILIGVCVNITEGTMADWTSVYMRDVVKSNPYFIGWGLSGYSFFMALGRLFGDKIIPKVGANKVLVYGGILSAMGMLIAVLYPMVWSSILGFALVGAGVSCAAPILYGSAARIPGVSKSSGLAVMNTFAMGGFMIGPVLIGFISEATSLLVAFGLVAVLALSWTWMSVRAKLF